MAINPEIIMKIWFWSILIIMTVAAWSCLLLPFYRNGIAALKRGHAAKIGIILFPLLVIAVYWVFGGSRQLDQFWSWQRQETQVQQEMAKLTGPQELIARLQDHLRAAPQSAEGWYLLGKLYLDQQQYAQAQASLDKAYQLQPNSAEIFIALAKADFFNHQQHLTPAIATQLNNMIESLPQPVDALNLLAVNAYRQQNYHSAVGYWQRALTFVPAGSPDSRALLDMIAQAEKQEGVDNGRNN